LREVVVKLIESTLLKELPAISKEGESHETYIDLDLSEVTQGTSVTCERPHNNDSKSLS
jgi:hypothetical protein